MHFVQVATWIPVDFVSQAILDLVHSADSPSAINVVHPRPITWSSVISAINEALVSEGVLASPLPLVDIQTWVSYLQGMSSNPSDETLGNIVSPKIKFPSVTYVCNIVRFVARN